LVAVVTEATKVLGKALVASPERRQEADADLDIVRQVQAGDVAAFDRLIIKYRERVYGIVYNMTSNREDAADLTQDAFIKAFQSIHRFGGQSSFLPGSIASRSTQLSAICAGCDCGRSSVWSGLIPRSPFRRKLLLH
jgi:hypothetical protein